MPRVFVRLSMTGEAARRNAGDLEAVFGAGAVAVAPDGMIDYTLTLHRGGTLGRAPAGDMRQWAAKLVRLRRVAEAEGAPVAVIKDGWDEADEALGAMLAGLGRLEDLESRRVRMTATPAR